MEPSDIFAYDEWLRVATCWEHLTGMLPSFLCRHLKERHSLLSTAVRRQLLTSIKLLLLTMS